MSDIDPDALLERQIKEWLTAAACLRARDTRGIADALTDPSREDNGQVYADSVAMLVTGATLCAHETAKALGARLGKLPDGAAVVMEDLAPGREPSAAERFALTLVMDAVNGDFDTLCDRVTSYARPDEAGVERVCDLTIRLLGLYVQISDANARSAS